MAWGARNLISTQVPTCLWVTVAAALNWSIYFRLGGAKASDCQVFCKKLDKR